MNSETKLHSLRAQFDLICLKESHPALYETIIEAIKEESEQVQTLKKENEKLKQTGLYISKCSLLGVKELQALKMEYKLEKNCVDYYASNGYSVACKRVKERKGDKNGL